MTFTPNSESDIAGLSVVLRSSHSPRKLQPLNGWLSEFDSTLAWVLLNSRHGVTRIMPVLPHAQPYPHLMQTICQQIGMSTTVEWQGRPYDMTGVEIDAHSLHVLHSNRAKQFSLFHYQTWYLVVSCVAGMLLHQVNFNFLNKHGMVSLPPMS